MRHAWSVCREVKRTLGGLLLVAAMTVTGQAASQADDAVTVLMKQALADMAGKEATLLTVSYGPGGTSDAHVHPGSVFAYVVEGAVTTQLEGEQPMTYTKGQSWYEAPKKPHLVSQNASQTEPAKLLVLLISQTGEKVKQPMPSSDHGH